MLGSFLNRPHAIAVGGRAVLLWAVRGRFTSEAADHVLSTESDMRPVEPLSHLA